LRDARFAMRLSLIVGLAMLIGKTTAYFMTHSAAIFSDAAESVVHVIAVGFAAFSLRLSTKSASPQFLYGYERITFFSAGFEGAMIVMAAIAILFESIRKWIFGLRLEHLGAGAPGGRRIADPGGWNTECGPRFLSPADGPAD
jgi:cation diffusion facilitator family transporter